MRHKFAVKPLVCISWGLCILISAMWLRSYIVRDSLGKRVPGRSEGIDSFNGHIGYGVLTSNYPDWESIATWKWQIDLGEPRGTDVPGRGAWRDLVFGDYDQ